MRVTVSIVNWNTVSELKTCLKSVFSQEGIEYEVIVVDNASSDKSAEMTSAKFPEVKLIANKKNLGFGRAHNQAIEIARGDYVLILNPDARLVETDTLSKLAAYADQDDKLGILGPKIENTDGSLQFSARRFPTIGAALFRRTPLGKLFPKNRFVKEYIMADWKHDEPREVDWVSGAAMMIRRETIDSIGALDPGFFLYCEDVDWCYRAWKNGWKVRYYPGAKVVHQIGAASDQDPIRMIYQFHRSMFKFYLKHYAKGWRGIFAPLVLLGLVARAVFFIILTRIPLSREALDSGEHLVR